MFCYSYQKQITKHEELVKRTHHSSLPRVFAFLTVSSVASSCAS